MTKSTITRERAQQIFLGNGPEPSVSEERELARMALAAFDTEPVQNHIGSKNSLDAIVSFIKSKSNPTVKCYEEVSEQLFKDNCHGIHSHVIEYILKLGEELEDLRAEYDEIQSAPEYPETLPCPVLLEPGLRFGKGIKTSTMLAALARRAVHESDMAALSPEERVEFQARIEDFKALIAQPAPVVLDGYVMVPMRLTAENGAKGALSGEFSETKFVNCPECFGDDECETCDGSGRIEITVPVTWTTIKEIWAKGVEHFAAAPHSPGSDPATVPGKWIPVSERMPEAGGDMIVFTDGIVMSGVSYAKKKGFYIQALEYDDDEPVDSVTHWMPLPAGPQDPNP